jgi:hypothetical protein
MASVSVICPSRQRAELLQYSITSLGPVHEILVRVDDDDPELELYQQNKDIFLSVGKRLGYERLNEYVNELSEDSTGDWLLLWNDDAVMETKDWQKALESYDPDKPAVLNIYKHEHNYFPLISRAFYEALGHYSVSPNSDSYVAEIARALNIEYDVPGITVRHLRGKLHDDTEANSLTVAPQMGPIHAEMRRQEIPEAIVKVRGAM